MCATYTRNVCDGMLVPPEVPYVKSKISPLSSTAPSSGSRTHRLLIALPKVHFLVVLRVVVSLRLIQAFVRNANQVPQPSQLFQRTSDRQTDVYGAFSVENVRLVAAFVVWVPS